MAIELSDLKVLVVEDDPGAMNIMKTVLKGMGIRLIYTARDGKAGLEFLSDASCDLDAFDGEALEDAGELVDLIVCDWKMPRMTGIEFLQKVRVAHPNMPFMMVTGNSDLNSIESAKKYAVNAYLIKPYSPQQIKQKLMALVSNL